MLFVSKGFLMIVHVTYQTSLFLTSQKLHFAKIKITCSTEIRRNWAELGTEKKPKYECIYMYKTLNKAI